MTYSKLTNQINQAINQHQKMTPKVQKDMNDLGFTYEKIGKYLSLRSKDLFIVEINSKYYVGVGMAATKYGYYEENFGMVKEITEKKFKMLKKETKIQGSLKTKVLKYWDYSKNKNIWL